MSKKLMCERCGYEWEYKGESSNYATCPDCKSSVKISDGVVANDERGRHDATTEEILSKLEELEERLYGVEKREFYSTNTDKLEERITTLANRVQKNSKRIRRLRKSSSTRTYDPTEEFGT